MSTPADDPTHALDDFLRRLHPAPEVLDASTDDPTDLSGLTARLHPGQAHGADRPAQPRGGTLRNGQRWQAADVSDVPVVDLPRDAARHTGATAATSADDWQPDPSALGLRAPTDARLVARWQPGAWIGAHRLVLQASTEFLPGAGGGAGQAVPVVESHEAQRLLLLWLPPEADAPTTGRWPQQVLLAPVSALSAPAALLAARPDSAAQQPLWIQPQSDDIDWALAAEIALHHVPGLRPFQIDGLRAFIAAEREAGFGRLNDRYRATPAGAQALAG